MLLRRDPTHFDLLLTMLLKRLFGWLPLGTMYGALLGHAVGTVASVSQLRLDDRPFYLYYGTLIGAAIGLVAGLFADSQANTKRKETSPPAAPIRYESPFMVKRLWLALPIVVLLYLFILPAFNPARE